MDNKKKTMYLFIAGGLLILLLIVTAIYFLTNNYFKNNNSNNTENNNCAKTISNLSNEVVNNSCSEYHFNVSDSNLDVKASLTSYDSSDHYTLKLTINDKEVTTDFFTNKDKKAIFNSVLLTTYQNYVIVKSDMGAEWNGQYVAVINNNGDVLFTYEAGEIGISNDTLNITKVKQLTSGVECKCDKTDSDNSTIIRTLYTYQIKDNKVTLQNTKDTTCADECLTD